MNATDTETLAGLVGDVDTFAEKHWGKRPLFRVAGDELSHLLSIADVEALLLSGAREPTFRMVRDGARLGAEHSTRPVRVAGQRITDIADPERIAAALSDGATLVAQGLETTCLPINRLCRALERATSHPVQANAYLTPAGAVGLAPHADEHDVIVVQQSGTKTWSVGGLGDDITLTPGDVLYMPAGTTHSAQAQTNASLHLTIGLLTRTWAAAVHDILDTVDELKAPLPLGYAHDPDLADHIATTLRRAIDALADVDATAVAHREAARSRHRRRPLMDGHLHDVLHLDAVDLDTVVVRRADRDAHLEDEANEVVVVLDDRRLGFPVIGLAALERLLSSDPVRVGDLPVVDDESKIVVARRLVRAGLVRTVAPDG